MATTKVTDAVIDTPGQLVNRWYAESGAVQTGTTAIPNDDTIPTSSEGDQFLTLTTDTLANSANRLRITALIQQSTSSDGEGGIALFLDSGSAAVATTYHRQSAENHPLTIMYEYAPGATTAVAVKIRAGTQSGSTTTVGGTGGSRKYGGVLLSTLVVEEILP
jgi:hypothetical protein